jgi:hypothetical protein
MPLYNKKQIDFVAAIAKLNLGPFGEQGARYAFKQVDFNGNGALDMSEVMQAYGLAKDFVEQQISQGPPE